MMIRLDRLFSPLGLGGNGAKEHVGAKVGTMDSGELYQRPGVDGAADDRPTGTVRVGDELLVDYPALAEAGQPVPPGE